MTIVKWHEPHETQSTERFWSEVNKYTDATGVNPFHELCELALSVLSLPHSNAEVERLFSQLNIVKTKLRNRLSTSSVSAIIAVKSGLKRVGKCCHSYELPKSVLKQIGTLAVYNRPASKGSGEPSPSTSTSTVAMVMETEEEEDAILFSLAN